jgi:hypothetical protein
LHGVTTPNNFHCVSRGDQLLTTSFTPIHTLLLVDLAPTIDHAT